MYFVASSGKSTETTIRVPLMRVRRLHSPTGAIHAVSAGSHHTACGVPLSMLILWPEHDFATHEFRHGCPNCAVSLAREETPGTAPTGFFVPGSRQAADDLSADRH